MRLISLSDYRNIVILTGAGISAASGLRTFRGPDGLWNDLDVERVSSVEALKSSPRAVWDIYGVMREAALAAKPNPAHEFLARMEASVAPGASFTLVTQNIDGLHQRAGSRNVLELHGNGFMSRCMEDSCAGRRSVRDEASHRDELPRCAVCGGLMRPDVVFFGEQVSVHAAWTAKRALRDCDLFLAVGTSGTVSPAADFVRGAHYAGAKTYFVNLESLPEPNPYFHESVIGRAEEVLPRLIAL